MKRSILFLILFLFLISFVSAQFELDNNTVALWHFDEGSGNMIFDETSNNNDGTISGATWINDSISGTALEFDGIDDKISIPFSTSIGVLPEITLEAWVKRNSELDGMVISKNGPYFLSVRNNVVEAGVFAGPPSWQHVNGTTVLETSIWNHIAMTYDGTNVKVYLNRIEDGSEPKTGSIFVTGQDLHIGWGEPGHNQFFNGTIDGARISNISRIFNVTEPPEPEPSLEERVAALEERVDELEDRVSFLERMVQKIKKFIRNLPRGLSKRFG